MVQVLSFSSMVHYLLSFVFCYQINPYFCPHTISENSKQGTVEKGRTAGLA